jgi:DNA-binding beta-propeller fold protein YncE
LIAFTLVHPHVDDAEMKSHRLIALLLASTLSVVAPAAPLELEAKIPLGDVRGRIDHLAVDLKRHRLYVAELGNDSVGVVDLNARNTVRTLLGLKAPQGIGYVPSTDTLYIANAGDGSVRLFQGEDLDPIGQIALGEDADNVRVDDAVHRIFIGYGDGALAVIDTASRRKIADIALGAHPESFQLERSGEHIVVNVPDRHEIAYVDREANKQVASWSTNNMRANFPLALDETHQRALAVFRRPATIGFFLTCKTIDSSRR